MPEDEEREEGEAAEEEQEPQITLFTRKGLMLAILVFSLWLSIKLVYFYNIDMWYLAA